MVPTLPAAVKRWFADVGRAIVTTFEGLAVTSSWMFRRPLTIQYPDKIEKPVQEMLPASYRGLLEVDLDRCAGCLLCNRACPIGALQVKVEKNPQTGGREIVQFDIDIGRCMFCGLCSEQCKFGALAHTTHFEAVVDSPDGLVLHFARKPTPVSRHKEGQGPPRRAVGSILPDIVPPCLGRVPWRPKGVAAEPRRPDEPPAPGDVPPAAAPTKPEVS